VSPDVWQPTLGAWRDGGQTHFRVWAPERRNVELVTGERHDRTLGPLADGFFGGSFDDIHEGTLYRYRLDGEGPFPDPASRFQPDGVHGPSAVVNSRTFEWSDTSWKGRTLEELVIYELHVGTFSPAGSFTGVAERLPYLRDLGVTAVELMPVADFPGARNWGYDGVALFAPARCYGRPDDLRRLVSAAHDLGIAVLLDVVYNHFGPDGAYLHAFSPHYVTPRRDSPWGATVNLDGDHAVHVREFLIENALHWLHEYHLDGLRLDATHALHDDSPRHFLADLASRVRASVTGRHVLLIAEDHRNLATMVEPPGDGGWGLDAVWADDFHHAVRRLVAGDADGYYEDYRGTTSEVAAAIERGWLYTGQRSEYLGEPRGTDPTRIAFPRFVFCLQNHDQIGNRAFGERLNTQIDLAAFRAATALLLTAPETPLLFMGQEWAADTPFLYFTDHHAELGRMVTEGRRREFGRFDAFADAGARTRIPDPQAEDTFIRSQLVWSEQGRIEHATMLRLYAALLALRREEPAFHSPTRDGLAVVASDGATLVLQRTAGRDAIVNVVRLAGAGPVDLDALNVPGPSRRPPGWTCLLTTEDPAFSPDPLPPDIAWRSDAGPVVTFARPAAVVFRIRALERGAAP
jgi:maltooligosyltrehalose trehalohydrolase